MNTLRHFCSDCGTEEIFEEVTLEESLKVKGVTVTNTHVYLKCPKCEELFEPFDDPERNLILDYREYRKIKGFLQPEEIIRIRKKYDISLRTFSMITGISHSTISNIENNSLQNKEHDSIFRLSSDVYSFKKLVEQRKAELEETVYVKLIKKLDLLCATSYVEHKELVVNYHNDLIIRVNNIEYDVKKIQSKIDRTEEGEVTWTSNLKKAIPLLKN